ncbi:MULTISPECIES: methylated-DNA--[protein]-cysteine S-methyltransferase [unclassified Spirosoma]|uniref:methylated-DNA--[protein]-cysteine S-methyltransferase n=1 Tax=unclassified Spirosoma TaxID=2621999 RepID=UPI000968BBF3|nr:MULTISPECIES: methylated-DNA--[protein]-cysteine S-methyltransferase [unclassified Spirosoma]MBN8822559.1 methylated-DNA--[protein]-cysteine S-methyltransferase [Spirosoma sp.]OJW74055.1 MAG: cysteine methyltransferase [Spirosoma sp. 48-14]
MNTVVFESPLGLVRISGDVDGVSVISCTDVSQTEEASVDKADLAIAEPVQQAVQQLQEYFAGTRQSFDFLLNPAGTEFQQTVWKALLNVPFGTTQSYLALSRRIGDEKAIRAVAAANGRNPLWIVVPCHRIIGSDGSLTGYAGGLWRKKWLLEHEGAFAKSSQLSLF